VELTRLRSVQGLPRRLLIIGLVVALLLSAGYAVYRSLPKGEVASQGSFDPFASRAEYDAFHRDHPVLTSKPPLEAPFMVDASISRDKQLTYRIELFASAIKPDNPSSVQRHIAMLKANQQAAKDWLTSLGEDPETSYIVWSPDPASYTTPTQTTAPPIPPPADPAHD
jgi:hypothetical protein